MVRMPSPFFFKEEELKLVHYSPELLQPLNWFVHILKKYLNGKECIKLVAFLISAKLVWCIKTESLLD